MDKLIARYNELEPSLSQEAKQLFSELLQRLSHEETLNKELNVALESEKKKKETSNERANTFMNAYFNLLNRS